MSPFRGEILCGLVVGLLSCSTASAQEALPHIGYAYPAGGQQGTTFQVTLGGQFLNEIGRVSFSGDGIEARVLETKPMIEAQINELRKKATELSRDKKNINALREAAKIQRKLVRYTMPRC